MHRQRLWFVGVLSGLLCLGLISISWWHGTRSMHEGNKLVVAASFYPMADFARQIGGDKIVVTTLVKPGTEPHDFEPSPRDVSDIYKAKVFIYNGAGLEKWADRMQADLTAHGVRVLRASDGMQLRTISEDNQSASDPHVWLDPVRAEQQAKAITGSLMQADPANSAYYQQREQQFIEKLQALDTAFRSGLASCQQRSIIASHESLGYIADRYNLQVEAIAGLSPDDEPSPQQLATIAASVKAKQLHYIFFESLVSPKLADTIAHEVGIGTLQFNPLEGLTPQELQQGENYLSVQYQNLQNLRRALDCT